MRFGTLGTGVVGKTIAACLAGLGHNVVIGIRDRAKTTSRVPHQTRRLRQPHVRPLPDR
jgi:predicted dinucleotide-binding enzyme